MRANMEGNDAFGPTSLLLSVAEQLKLPLTHIARQAELSEMVGQCSPAELQTIRLQADAALSLVDSYMLGLQLLARQGQLELEPVSASAVLAETAHDLEQLARRHHVELVLEVEGRNGPVMAHRNGLKAALLSLGHALIEAQSAQGVNRCLSLRTYRGTRGVVVGVYGAYEALDSAQWRAAIALCGQARQPCTALGAGSTAGVFVADAIVQAMDTRLRVGYYHKQSGLAVTLHPSQQLQLI